MELIAKYAARILIALVGTAFGVWLQAIDQDQMGRAPALAQAAVEAFKVAERRRVTGSAVNSELSLGSHLDIIREKKGAFDAAFVDHQEKVNQVFAAASYGFGRDSEEYRRFTYLYEDQLAECMLKPMRANLEAHYRCTVAGGQNCTTPIALDKEKCGMNTASFKVLSDKARECVTELRAAVTRSLETRARYLGVAGRLSFLLQAVVGTDTEITTDGRSWREALLTADERECRLHPAAVVAVQK